MFGNGYIVAELDFDSTSGFYLVWLLVLSKLPPFISLSLSLNPGLAYTQA